MARTTIELTTSYQQIAAGKCVITFDGGAAEVHLNDTASDTAAMSDAFSKNAQIVQNEDKPTFARSREPVTVIVDEV